jgi:hypothetical protein
MVNTDAIAVDLVAASSVIDDMEASAGVYGAEDKKFLAKYQVKLASTRTSPSEDFYFLGLFCKYFSVRFLKKT